MNITESELIERYNKQVDYIHSLPNMPARDILNKLSDDDLFIFVAGQTLAYGRTFEKSIENAKYHMQNGRESVIKAWAYGDSERVNGI